MNMENKLFVGTGIADITPTEDMLPMSRNAPSGGTLYGVIDHLFVRAIAVKSGEKTLLLITFDLGGAPDPADYLKAITEKTGIPEENIFFMGTHAHAAPPCGKVQMGRKVERTPAMIAYDELVEKQLWTAVDSALASLKPARYGYAFGESYINTNRNIDYRIEKENGEIEYKCSLGLNGKGPIDRTLFTMRFEDLDGKPIAFFINYPMHNVVMHANVFFGEKKMGISSDVGGNVSQYLEKKYPGTVAMWTSGAAGDVNPIMMCQQCFPDPVTGEMTIHASGNTDALNYLAGRHYQDVLMTLDKITEMKDHAAFDTEIKISYTPGRDVEIIDPTNFNSEAREIINDDTDPYDVRMHLLRFGDLAFLGTSGELYTSLSLHLKEIAPMNLIVITHDASGLCRSGYIYDDDGIARKALHYNRSRIRPGYVKDSLSRIMLEEFDDLLNK